MPELLDVGSIIGRNINRAFARVRREGFREGYNKGFRKGFRKGYRKGMCSALRRLAQKKFGAAGQGELPGLVAGLRDVGQLENALDYVLECDDPGQFARFLQADFQRKLKGGTTASSVDHASATLDRPCESAGPKPIPELEEVELIFEGSINQASASGRSKNMPKLPYQVSCKSVLKRFGANSPECM